MCNANQPHPIPLKHTQSRRAGLKGYMVANSKNGEYDRRGNGQSEVSKLLLSWRLYCLDSW